jgi:hypothetical protein
VQVIHGCLAYYSLEGHFEVSTTEGFRLCSYARRNHLETQRNPEWSLVNVKPTHDNEDSQIEKGNNPWTGVVMSYLHSLHHWHRHVEIIKFFQVIMLSIK